MAGGMDELILCPRRSTSSFEHSTRRPHPNRVEGCFRLPIAGCLPDGDPGSRSELGAKEFTRPRPSPDTSETTIPY
jgi:hypothetical protein